MESFACLLTLFSAPYDVPTPVRKSRTPYAVTATEVGTGGLAGPATAVATFAVAWSEQQGVHEDKEASQGIVCLS